MPMADLGSGEAIRVRRPIHVRSRVVTSLHDLACVRFLGSTRLYHFRVGLRVNAIVF